MAGGCEGRQDGDTDEAGWSNSRHLPKLRAELSPCFEPPVTGGGRPEGKAAKLEIPFIT